MTDPQVQTSYYKFTDDTAATAMLAGRFWLRPLDYFRMLEIGLNDRSIGDSMEAVSRTRFSHRVRPEDDNTNLNRALAGQITVEDGADVTFDGAIVDTQLDGLAFSLSHGDLIPLWAEMSTSTDYTCCLKIEDINAFRDGLEAGRRTDGAPAGMGHAACGREVVYDWSEASYGLSAMLGANPFLKRPRYASQQEYRIFFATGERTPDHIEITAPDAARFLTKVPLQSPPKTPTDPYMPVAEARQIMAAILARTATDGDRWQLAYWSLRRHLGYSDPRVDEPFALNSFTGFGGRLRQSAERLSGYF